MTTVIAVEGKYVTKFVADSRETQGYRQNNDSVKIARNGEYTFASAGYARSIQVLEFAKLPPIPDTSVNNRTRVHHDTLDRFFSLEIVPAIRSAFEEYGDIDKLKRSSILVALKNRVYDVNGPCGAWARNSNGFYGIGSGSDYALGALAAGATPEEAVRIAGRYDTYTNQELTVVEAMA